ncbi:hypothetical protein V1522DRAFT_424472 [Lipomyces starkeyi]
MFSTPAKTICAIFAFVRAGAESISELTLSMLASAPIEEFESWKIAETTHMPGFLRLEIVVDCTSGVPDEDEILLNQY